jgi:hypothetical protein
VFLRLLARSRTFYDGTSAALAALDGRQAMAVIRDTCCLTNDCRRQDIDHVAVLLMNKNGRTMMGTAECTTRLTETQWCENPEHKREILRSMLKRLDELYP